MHIYKAPNMFWYVYILWRSSHLSFLFNEKIKRTSLYFFFDLYMVIIGHLTVQWHTGTMPFF